LVNCGFQHTSYKEIKQEKREFMRIRQETQDDTQGDSPTNTWTSFSVMSLVFDQKAELFGQDVESSSDTALFKEGSRIRFF